MTLTQKGKIARSAEIVITDAAFSIWEDGLSGSPAEREAWKRKFRDQVFKRITQKLRSIGWTVEIPQPDPHSIKHYGRKVAIWSALRHRNCQKGDLYGELKQSGRTIEFEMWQGINTPTRPDHGGRYESNKEDVAPFLLRMEMFRTRNAICQYLCSVFADYKCVDKRSPKPLQLTAAQQIQSRYDECCHIKGDIEKYLESTKREYSYKSADGQHITHGQRVWTTDSRGRWMTGIAHASINSMWLVVTGKYDFCYKSSGEIHTAPPPNLRTKKNDRQRTQALHKQLAEAVHLMNYERAAIIRDVMFNKHERLWNVYHTGHKLYHRANYCGYTDNQTEAGIFRESELCGIGEVNELRPIPQRP